MCNMKAPSLLVRKLWPRLKFLSMHSCTHPNTRAMTLAKKLWYHVKGLVIRNTHVEYDYESLITSGLKVMTKVKVF